MHIDPKSHRIYTHALLHTHLTNVGSLLRVLCVQVSWAVAITTPQLIQGLDGFETLLDIYPVHTSFGDILRQNKVCLWAMPGFFVLVLATAPYLFFQLLSDSTSLQISLTHALGLSTCVLWGLKSFRETIHSYCRPQV